MQLLIVANHQQQWQILKTNLYTNQITSFPVAIQNDAKLIILSKLSRHADLFSPNVVNYITKSSTSVQLHCFILATYFSNQTSRPDFFYQTWVSQETYQNYR